MKKLLKEKKNFEERKRTRKICIKSFFLLENIIKWKKEQKLENGKNEVEYKV